MANSSFHLEHLEHLEQDKEQDKEQEIIKKKRGRKKNILSMPNNANEIIDKLEPEMGQENNTAIIQSNNNDIILKETEENKMDVETDQYPKYSSQLLLESTIPTVKKRGRKPKGGKIIMQTIEPLPPLIISNSKSSVVLHLKCFLNQLNKPNNPPISDCNNEQFYHCASKSNVVLNYNLNSTSNLEGLEVGVGTGLMNPILDSQCPINNENETENLNSTIDLSSVKSQELNAKLKVLETQLHHNNINKSSACFWCSFDFETNAIYIPKYIIKNTYHVYGCFCSPECAVASLMNDNLDSSTKFERYALLNNLYGSILGNTKNFSPAPNPHYILDRYYGNLSINEYRSLFKSNKHIFIIDKPLTKIMPELHLDNTDLLHHNKLLTKDYQPSLKKEPITMPLPAYSMNINTGAIINPFSVLKKENSLKTLFTKTQK